MSRWSKFSQSRAGQGAVLGLLLIAAIGIMGQSCTPQPQVIDPNSGLTGNYVGSERCLTCHNRTHAAWSQTRHAQSYDELVALGEETNPVCLTCHTTGYGQVGGFQNIDTTELLAKVGCESCHGAAKDHVLNVADASLRPPVSMSADWCSQCHNGFHHDTYSEWSNSKHGKSTVGRDTEEIADELTAGTVANNCGTCHAADVQKAKDFNLILPTIAGSSTADARATTISDALLTGEPVEDIHGATCASCHNPHSNTGNSIDAPSGHDFQIRWAQVTNPDPANGILSTQDPTRFNICGQCHHNRSASWTSNSRPPHPTVQANMYVGEMPADEGQSPLVPNERSVHRFVPGQCTQCHMQHEAHLGMTSALDTSSETPTHVGHTFLVETFAGCVTSGCHPSEGAAQTDLANLQTEIQNRMDAILVRLGPVSTWGYSSAGDLPLGGPSSANQSKIPAQVRKVRYLWSYLNRDGSLGVHNPAYTRSILSEAESLLTQAGK